MDRKERVDILKDVVAILDVQGPFSSESQFGIIRKYVTALIILNWGTATEKAYLRLNHEYEESVHHAEPNDDILKWQELLSRYSKDKVLEAMGWTI